MTESRREDEAGAIEVLPGTVPVSMPELPPTLELTNAKQHKALTDPVRIKILNILQHQPATAKQVADRLGMAPGTINHQLQVLEEAGLARIIARRLVNGIVAKYYARTARIFLANFSREILGVTAPPLNRLRQAHDELAEALAADALAGEGADKRLAVEPTFLHFRLAPERASAFRERFFALLEDLEHGAPDPGGLVYSVCLAMFVAPSYLQVDKRPAAEGEAGNAARLGAEEEL